MTDHRHPEAGRAGALLLAGLALVLVAGGAMLWLVLGAGGPDDEEQGAPPEQVEMPPPERKGQAPRLVAPHVERPGQPGRNLVKSGQRLQKLVGHMRRGASYLDEKAAKIKVTVKAPAAPQGINPEIWAPLTETLPALTLCYQRRLMNNPHVKGNLVLSLKMVEGAGVARAETKILKHSTIKDPVFRKCVLQRLAGAAFPLGLAAAGEGATYPLVFHPGKVQVAAPMVAGAHKPPPPPPPPPPKHAPPPKAPPGAPAAPTVKPRAPTPSR